MDLEEHVMYQENEILKNRCRNMEQELAELKEMVRYRQYIQRMLNEGEIQVGGLGKLDATDKWLEQAVTLANDSKDDKCTCGSIVHLDKCHVHNHDSKEQKYITVNKQDLIKKAGLIVYEELTENKWIKFLPLLWQYANNLIMENGTEAEQKEPTVNDLQLKVIKLEEEIKTMKLRIDYLYRRLCRRC